MRVMQEQKNADKKRVMAPILFFSYDALMAGKKWSSLWKVQLETENS